MTNKEAWDFFECIDEVIKESTQHARHFYEKGQKELSIKSLVKGMENTQKILIEAAKVLSQDAKRENRINDKK